MGTGQVNSDNQHSPLTSVQLLPVLGFLKTFLSQDSPMGDVRTTLTLPSKLCHTMGEQVGSRGCGYRTQKSQGGAKDLGKHLRYTLSSEPCGGCQAPGAFPWTTPWCPCHSTHFCSLVWPGWEGKDSLHCCSHWLPQALRDPQDSAPIPPQPSQAWALVMAIGDQPLPSLKPVVVQVRCRHSD